MYSALLSLAISPLSRQAKIFQKNWFLEKTSWPALDKIDEKSSSFDCMSALILIVPGTHSTWDARLFVETISNLLGKALKKCKKRYVSDFLEALASLVPGLSHSHSLGV